MRLKTKLLIVLAPILMLQVAAFVVPASMVYQRAFEQQVVHHVNDYTAQLLSSYESHLDKLASASLLLSKSNVLQRYVSVPDPAVRSYVLHHTLMDEFSGAQDAYPSYYEISLVLPDGYEEARQVNNGVPDLTDDEAETYYIKAFNEHNAEFSVMSGINPDNNEWALISGRKIYAISHKDDVGGHSKYFGWLIIKTNIEFLKDFIKGSQLQEHGYFLLFHADGNVVWQNKAATKLGRQYRNYVKFNFMDKASINFNKVQNKYSVRMGDGNLINSVYRMPAGLNIALAWPESYITSLVKKTAWSRGGTTLVVMFLSLVFIYFFLDWLIMRPLEKLGNVANRIGAGLSSKNELDSIFLGRKDELGALYENIRSMGDRLLSQKRRLQNIAFNDSLTDLPNRRRFLNELESHFDKPDAQSKKIALLFVDLDGFKQVNDRFGHHVGDTILSEVAGRLKQTLRSADMISTVDELAQGYHMELARLGGDEFTVLLKNVENSSDVELIVNRILYLISRPFVFEGIEIFLSASIGICFNDSDNQSAVNMLKHADAAMYQAKKKGKNTFHYFDRSISESLSEYMQIKTSLLRALEKGDLSLAYQPQINLDRTELAGLEVLVRWYEDTIGWIRPDIFIPIAEDSGLINQLGCWVLEQACEQVVKWKSEGVPIVPVSVNVSNVQFSQGNVANVVEACLKKTGLPARFLKLEITESSIMQGRDSIEQIKKIREMGVKVSLDDFGTGYSSLSALRGLPLDQLKIDKSFISDLNNSEDSESIISAIIAMSKQLGLEVVAEGVETVFELELIKKYGAHIVQGFYFSEPLTAEKVKQEFLIADESKIDLRQ